MLYKFDKDTCPLSHMEQREKIIFFLKTLF